MKVARNGQEAQAVQFTEAMARGDEPVPAGVNLGFRRFQGDGTMVEYSYTITSLGEEKNVRVGNWILTWNTCECDVLPNLDGFDKLS